MKHLVIAEKPSVGRDIARVLHCNKKTNTYIEGTDYIVTWALAKEILNYIEYAKAKGCSMTGPEDPDILHLNVLA